MDKLNYRFEAREVLTHERMQGIVDKVDELVDGMAGAVAAVETVEGANFGGGVVYAERYGDDLEVALNAAIAASVEEGRAFTTIDCTRFTGEWTFRETVVVNWPVTIRLGNCHIVSHGENVFDIRSNNVRIEGLNRSTDRTDTTGNATVIVCTHVSGEPNEGYHIYSRGRKNCQYRNLYLKGTRTTLGRQCRNGSWPINGCGGIYIEKGNPGTTAAGNTCNATVIENVLMDGSKAHGIYIDTPILSMIRNCRLSNIAGHGVFVNGGTTVTLENVYVASARLAGVCLYLVTYCAVINSVVEYAGVGWWLRSCANVSVFSPGVEHTINNGKNPWSKSYGTTQNEKKGYGFGLTTLNEAGQEVRINDVPDEAYYLRGVSTAVCNMFVGIGYLVTGGRNIDIYSPYVTGIGFDPEGGDDVVQAALRYFIVTGNARAVNVSNVGFSGGSSGEAAHKEAVRSAIAYEMEIGSEVDGIDVSFNPTNSTLAGVVSVDEPVTANTAVRAQILNLCENAQIRYGNTYYTGLRLAGGLAIDGVLSVGRLNVEGQLYAGGGILYRGSVEKDLSNVDLELNVTYSPAGTEIEYVEDGFVLRMMLSAVLGDADVTRRVAYEVYLNGSLYGTYSGEDTVYIPISSPGAYSVYVVATYSDGKTVKTATSETRYLTYKAKAVVQPTFYRIESAEYEEKTYTVVFCVRSSFEITEAGAAHSPSNTSPTVNQNKAVASSIVADENNAEVYHVTVTANRSNASQTRYVRFYYATNDSNAETTERQYSETYVVQGSSITPYEG